VRGTIAIVLATVASAFALGGQTASAECANGGLPAGCEGEEGQAVSMLRAVVKAHHGSSYQHPGYTTINVVSTPEAAYLTVSEPRTRTHLQWLTAETEGNVVKAQWSCRRPRQTFRDILTARGNVGATVSTEITFHAQITRRWCSAAMQREEAQRAAAKRQHEAELREAKRREAEQHEAEQHESASTCTNGTYVNSAGNTVCKPEESSTGPPAGATAECVDGTYSFSESRSGTCSHHGGVARWL
jgi:hypothetical protein